MSDTIRVTVTVLRSDAAKVSVSAQQTLDENGNPMTAGVIPADEKTVLPAVLNQERSVEFNFPADATTLIKSGTWNFFISVQSIVPAGGDAAVWQTTCMTKLQQSGVNNLDAVENMATCTGDFVVFAGQHEVGLDGLKVEPDNNLRVGDKASIKFVATNNGANSEAPFGVTIRAIDSTQAPVMSQMVTVPALPSGAVQNIPATGPSIIWNTTNLRPGTYTVEAALTSPIPGDPQPGNDKTHLIVELAPGDFDGDGVADDIDNCPTVPNADQANCDATDPEGKLGNACKTAKIKGVVPNTCSISGGATVTVTGFGFAKIQAQDIQIGSVKAEGKVKASACTLQFTNPSSNPNPVGFLSIQTTPPVQTPLCCQAPTINQFSPTTGAPASPGHQGTEIYVLGCGLTGATAMLSTSPNGTPQFPLSSTIGSSGELLTFNIPGVPTGVYWIELRQGTTDVRSQDLLLVHP